MALTVSPAAKLCGFLLLLAVIFIGAYAAGAHLGPVTVSSTTGPPDRAGQVARAVARAARAVARAAGRWHGRLDEYGRPVSGPAVRGSLMRP